MALSRVGMVEHFTADAQFINRRRNVEDKTNNKASLCAINIDNSTSRFNLSLNMYLRGDAVV